MRPVFPPHLLLPLGRAAGPTSLMYTSPSSVPRDAWVQARDALEGKGPQRRPRERLGRRLAEVDKAVGGGYCRLQMPLKLALGVRETVAEHRLPPPPPSNASPVQTPHSSVSFADRPKAMAGPEPAPLAEAPAADDAGESAVREGGMQCPVPSSDALRWIMRIGPIVSDPLLHPLDRGVTPLHKARAQAKGHGTVLWAPALDGGVPVVGFTIGTRPLFSDRLPRSGSSAMHPQVTDERLKSRGTARAFTAEDT